MYYVLLYLQLKINVLCLCIALWSDFCFLRRKAKLVGVPTHLCGITSGLSVFRPFLSPVHSVFRPFSDTDITVFENAVKLQQKPLVWFPGPVIRKDWPFLLLEAKPISPSLWILLYQYEVSQKFKFLLYPRNWKITWIGCSGGLNSPFHQATKQIKKQDSTPTSTLISWSGSESLLTPDPKQKNCLMGEPMFPHNSNIGQHINLRLSLWSTEACTPLNVWVGSQQSASVPCNV
jgi:hypothetical protein